MKKFIVTLDVTFSGDVEIDAENEKEVAEIIRNMKFNASNLKGFYLIGKDIFQIREVK